MGGIFPAKYGSSDKITRLLAQPSSQILTPRILQGLSSQRPEPMVTFLTAKRPDAEDGKQFLHDAFSKMRGSHVVTTAQPAYWRLAPVHLNRVA